MTVFVVTYCDSPGGYVYSVHYTHGAAVDQIEKAIGAKLLDGRSDVWRKDDYDYRIEEQEVGG